MSSPHTTKQDKPPARMSCKYYHEIRETGKRIRINIVVSRTGPRVGESQTQLLREERDRAYNSHTKQRAALTANSTPTKEQNVTLMCPYAKLCHSQIPKLALHLGKIGR